MKIDRFHIPSYHYRFDHSRQFYLFVLKDLVPKRFAEEKGLQDGITIARVTKINKAKIMFIGWKMVGSNLFL